MSDKPRIPSWQRVAAAKPEQIERELEHSSQPAEHSEQCTTSNVEAPAPTEGDLEDPQNIDLLDQAKRFLDDATIRDAPREKKVAFLESKGVSADDIDTLLGAEVQEVHSSELEAVEERAWSTAPPQPVPASQPSPQPRDIPPIVTYPEFLAQTERHPPLITTQRLLSTAYVTGGLMATLYGLSKYVVAPMTQNLTESRLEFAAHTQEHLDEFNKRLGASVSVDPAKQTKAKSTDVADNVSDADSDPTELYHRDCGTQTTPELSRRPSVAGADDSEPIVTGHENRLKIMKSHLQELEATKSNDTSSATSLKTRVSDLTSYLSEMSYQTQYYSNMNGLYGSSFGLPGAKEGKNDQIEVLKSEIRAVKGVFLSARNFPTGGRSTPPIPTGRVDA